LKANKNYIAKMRKGKSDMYFVVGGKNLIEASVKAEAIQSHHPDHEIVEIYIAEN